MIRKSKLLICMLFMCLGLAVLPGMKSNAEETAGETASASENQDENSQRLEEITGMEEDGEIYEVTVEDGMVEETVNANARTAGPLIVNFNTKSSSVNTDFTDTVTGDSGYTNGSYGADAAYLGTSGGKIKFMLAGVIGLVDPDDVELVEYSTAESVSYYEVSGGKLIHNITYNLNSSKYASSLNNGPAPSYLSAGTKYYSYDGHYFYKDYQTMLSDYQNDSRKNSVNSGNPFYNYYQYLPLRSQTAYGADSLNSIINGKVSSSSKLKGTGSSFVKYQNTYGVNALLSLSVAANESGWGTSSISQNKNNLFGLNAVDSSPGTSANTYASVDECIRQFMGNYMSAKYLNPAQWQYYGGFLGNKASGINVKYASDPYWGEKAAAIAWTLDGLGGNADQDRYTIGVKEGSSSVNVRNGASTSATKLYTTGSQLSHAVLVLNSEPENNFYRIQSDAVLNADRTATSSSSEYDFDAMYAYISADYVTVVSRRSEETVEPEEPVLESVTIVNPPSKTEYEEGETPDMTGIKVTAKWSDGSETDVTDQIVYSTDSLAAGTTKITISYTAGDVTVTADQAVTVNKKAAEPAEPSEPEGTTPGESDPAEDDSDKPAVENPSDQPTTDKPAETPDADQPTVDEPTETPDADQPATDEPAETPDTDQPATDEPAETPDADQPTTDEPTETPDADQPTVDEPAETPDSDQPVQEKPDNEQNVAEKPEAEQENASDDTALKGSENSAVSEKTLRDMTTGIRVTGSFADDAMILVKSIEPNTEEYSGLVSPLDGKTILGVYDISVNNGADGKMQLTFRIDSKYNGKEVVILHYTDTENYEKYNAKVENGSVTITVDKLSRFVVALNSGENQNAVPKTGDDLGGLTYWIVLLCVSAAAVGMVAGAKKKALKLK